MSVVSPRVEDGWRDGRETGSAYFTGTVKIPGYDYRPQRCQPLHPVGFCEDHGHPVLGASSCGNRGCPEHYGHWVRDGAVRDTERLAAFRQAADGAGKRLLHVVVSPPQDRRWSARAVWETRGDAYRVAEEVGVRGGAVYTHPYRDTDAGKEFFKTAVEAGDWERSRGKWSLFRDTADDWEDLQQYIRPSPHYHILGAARDLDVEAAPDGWVVERIRSFDRFHLRDLEAYRDMTRTAYYLRTHAGTQQGRQSVTWFGDIHPAVFAPEEELTAVEWERIQLNAGRVPETEPGGTPRETGVDAMECPRDGCQSDVVGIERLRAYLNDGAWLRSLEPTERRTLWGLQVWILEELDRPPPSIAANRMKVLQWCEKKGRTFGPTSNQVGIGNWGLV